MRALASSVLLCVLGSAGCLAGVPAEPGAPSAAVAQAAPASAPQPRSPVHAQTAATSTAQNEPGEPTPPAAQPEPAGTEPAAPEGRLPAESIQTIVRWNVGRFRGCYQQALTRLPALEGRVVIAFVVAPSGVVDEARVVESDVPAALSDCLSRAFLELRFGASSAGPIRVAYPFTLTRGGLVPAFAGSHPNQRTPGQGAAGPTDAQARADAELYQRFVAGLSQPVVAELPATAAAEPLPAEHVAPLPSRPGCESTDPLCADL